MVPAFPFLWIRGDEGAAVGRAPGVPSLPGERLPMQVRALLTSILSDDALTRGLNDPEARILVEWLVEQAERLARGNWPESAVWTELRRLCRRGRAIARFVRLWCHERERGAAVQLAAAERFTWPLPTRSLDPCELMQGILTSEASSFAA